MSDIEVPREWAAVAAQVSARWPHAPWSRATAAAMADDLADHDPRAVLAAVKAYARQPGANHPPKLHDLLSLLEPPTREFGDAWREIMAAVRDCNHIPCQPPPFADPAVELTVRQLGWRVLCNSRTGDTTLFAQARDVYNAAVRRVRDDLTRGELGLPTGDSPFQKALRAGVRDVYIPKAVASGE